MRNLAVLLLSLAGIAQAGAADRFDSVRSFIEAQRVEGDIAGISVAVSQRGRIVWEQGFGWADRENRIPATEHTMFSLASISKPITATGLMTLVQAGKVDLDKPVNDYLGAAQLKARVGDARDATVRRVANHSSGLPLHYHLIYSDEPYRKASTEETLAHYGNLITLPGERVEYSNLGYGVLDYIIRRVSGMSYADFMAAEVFAPLGLTRMSVGLSPATESLAAVRYNPDGSRIAFYDSDHQGASAVYGSAHDLVRFAMFHLKDHRPDQRAILSDASLDEMQRRTVNESERSGYGVSWNIVDRDNGYRTVEHGGGMPGVGVVLLMIPSEDIAVAVLTNHRQGRHRAIADKVLQTLLPKWRPQPKQERGDNPPFVPGPQLQGKWSGSLHTYKSEIPITVEFLASGEVRAGLRGQHVSIVRQVRYNDGLFEGLMAGQLDTPDARWNDPGMLDLSLRLRGDRLTGGAATTSEDWRAGALTHWVELRRN
ncbi:serine hydrolase domain-containing protein [Steroidobacter sp.]|uniref:serine hydrolase domain-containing protein n=1 Tax=Steroidobacter sp. TaxID=1978227 RepID=UPI001A3B5B31|nr:serine hydrolase domain-containing protein [Steroidobacter sp.]MBL8267906.1 serine hydrolase [Steroidobacter sp.]